MGKAEKVMVLMSGGVDSTMAVVLLQEAGYACEGMYMVNTDAGPAGAESVKAVAEKLGVKLHVEDLRNEFSEVLEYFCSEYERGRTPNPCVFCNRRIKFGRLLESAKEKGADLLATGHYARVMETEDGWGLFNGVDKSKDQSYALAMIDRAVLSQIRLPMGEFTKKQTRELAGRHGLARMVKSESQDICFIPGDDYVRLVEERMPGLVKEGRIVDGEGRLLGTHEGTHRYTIGQRRGLGVAMGRPYYVTQIDALSNTVTLGPKSEVTAKGLRAEGVRWLMDAPREAFRAEVKIRYNSPARAATVYPEGGAARAEFDEAVSAITPGQLAAFYRAEGPGLRVLGGGWIEAILD
jgi:tRNA-specific 2-thiouridylase